MGLCSITVIVHLTEKEILQQTDSQKSSSSLLRSFKKMSTEQASISIPL
jgi:hypothetical protein